MSARKLFLLFVLMVAMTAKADASPWNEFKQEANKQLQQKTLKQPHFLKSKYFVLDESEMISLMQSNENQNRADGLKYSQKRQRAYIKKIPIPLSNGLEIRVGLRSTRVLPDSKSVIETYKIVPDDLLVGGRVDMGINGFHAMLRTRAGDTFFIDPVDVRENDQTVYVSYRKQDQKNNHKQFSCGAKFSEERSAPKQFASRGVNGSQKSLLTYRIAVAATGEYVAKKGGTVEKALAAIATSINRVNQVFEQDLGIHLELVENNHKIIYTDAETDPFNAVELDDLLAQNQRNTDRVIGSSHYDIGHLFTTEGGGLAAIASVCKQSRKAKGVSGISHPENDSFNLDFVAHEIAHQLGATHTFNSQQGLCAGDTREGNTAFEPGSGSTIMSYAGYCGVDNLQLNTDAMLHIGSIQQVRRYTSKESCGVRTQSNNAPPIVDAGQDYIIPARTPFELKGVARDDDQLVYSWEQIDAGRSSLVNDDKGDNAIFRTHLPDSSPTRSFPPLENILNHTELSGEELPFYQRKLNFSFTAQDGYNSTQSDEMTVKVVRTGSRFALNLPLSSYIRGESYQVFWNEAGSSRSPINCSSVNIALSTDGGLTFDQVLASGVPNIGEVWVSIPTSTQLSSAGRFKISCSDNIFFAISYRNFNIKADERQVAHIYSDEGLAEFGLDDKPIGEDGLPSLAPLVESSGGPMDFWLMLFLLPLLARKPVAFKV